MKGLAILIRIASLVMFILFFYPSVLSAGIIDWDELVEMDGDYYKKGATNTYTGKVTGLREGMMVKGKPDGPWVMYYKNGNIKSTAELRNGKIEGKYLFWFKNGQLQTKGYQRNGQAQGSWIGYYENGQILKSGSYNKGKQSGPWVFYYESGQLWAKGDFNDGNKVGSWIYYHSNGRLDTEWSGTYMNNIKLK